DVCEARKRRSAGAPPGWRALSARWTTARRSPKSTTRTRCGSGAEEEPVERGGGWVRCARGGDDPRGGSRGRTTPGKRLGPARQHGPWRRRGRIRLRTTTPAHLDAPALAPPPALVYAASGGPCAGQGGGQVVPLAGGRRGAP